MPNKSVQKGKRAEYQVRDLIKGYGYDARRSPMSGAIKGLGWEADILSKNFPFFCEVKNVEKPQFLKYYKKAENECGTKPPIIIWTKNREDIYVFLLFTDFMTILTQSTASNLKQKFSKTKGKPKKVDMTSSLKFSKTQSARRKK